MKEVRGRIVLSDGQEVFVVVGHRGISARVLAASPHEAAEKADAELLSPTPTYRVHRYDGSFVSEEMVSAAPGTTPRQRWEFCKGIDMVCDQHGGEQFVRPLSIPTLNRLVAEVYAR